jgi:hypothetical protein
MKNSDLRYRALLPRIFSVLILAAAYPAFADISDVFREYVDRIVPVTHQVARESAQGKELAVLVSSLSCLQARLAAAAVHASQVDAYLAGSAVEQGPLCPKTESGLVDLKAIFRRSSWLLQAVNHASELAIEVAAFEKEKQLILQRCSDAQSFGGYDESQLGLRFAVPEQPSLLDGIQIVYGDGGGLETIPLVGSVIRLGINIKEQKAIRELEGKLEAQHVHTEDYRRYAREQCTAALDGARAQLEEYSQLARSLLEFAEKIPTPRIKELAGRIQGCADDYERQLVQLLKNEAEDLARRKFGQEEDEARFWLLYPDWKAAFQTDAAAVQNSDATCEKREPIFLELSRRLSVAKLVGATSDPVVKMALVAAAAFDRQCGVAP